MLDPDKLNKVADAADKLATRFDAMCARGDAPGMTPKLYKELDVELGRLKHLLMNEPKNKSPQEKRKFEGYRERKREIESQIKG